MPLLPPQFLSYTIFIYKQYLPDLNCSDSPSRLSYPTPRLRVSDKQCSIKAIRLSRSHIDQRLTMTDNLCLHYKLPLQLASASILLFLRFGARICSAGPTKLPLTPAVNQQDQLLNQGTEQEEDEKLKQEFENWKSKTFESRFSSELSASILG